MCDTLEQTLELLIISSRFQHSRSNVGIAEVTTIPNAPIPSTTAHSRSKIVGKSQWRSICQESSPQCAAKSGRRCTVCGDITDRVLTWGNRVSKATKDSASCEPEATTSSWSTAHVSDYTPTWMTEINDFSPQATPKTDAIMREQSTQNLQSLP
jgi:hypothetical protein